MQRTRLAVDELDMRILRELVSGDADYFRGDRATLDDVARILGVHRNTVSERVSRMESNGFMLPLTLEVEPGAVGLIAVIAALDVPPDRRTDATREALLALEGVWGLLTYLDAWLLLVHAQDEDTIAKRIEEASALAGARLAEIESNSRRDYPGVQPVPLSPLDVRIIDALMRDARRSLRAVAADLGVTAKTVERRFARLEREGVVMGIPTGGTGASGLTMGDIRVELPDDPAARRTGVAVLEKLLPNHWFRSIRPRGLVHYGVFAPSVSDLEDQAGRVRAVPEVRRVGLRIWTGQYQSPRYAEWLIQHLERQAAVGRPSQGSSSP